MRMREFPEEILKFCFCAGGKGLRSLAPAPARSERPSPSSEAPSRSAWASDRACDAGFLRFWDQIRPRKVGFSGHTHGKQLVAEGEMDRLFLCTALSADPRLPWRNPWLILTLEAPLYHQLSDPCPLSPARRPAFMLCPLHGMPPSLCTPADGPVLLCPPFPSRPSPL